MHELLLGHLPGFHRSDKLYELPYGNVLRHDWSHNSHKLRCWNLFSNFWFECLHELFCRTILCFCRFFLHELLNGHVCCLDECNQLLAMRYCALHFQHGIF
jgi:hypothetical protein